jgi:hypothetical protein
MSEILSQGVIDTAAVRRTGSTTNVSGFQFFEKAGAKTWQRSR